MMTTSQETGAKPLGSVYLPCSLTFIIVPHGSCAATSYKASQALDERFCHDCGYTPAVSQQNVWRVFVCMQRSTCQQLEGQGIFCCIDSTWSARTPLHNPIGIGLRACYHRSRPISTSVSIKGLFDSRGLIPHVFLSSSTRLTAMRRSFDQAPNWRKKSSRVSSIRYCAANEADAD